MHMDGFDMIDFDWGYSQVPRTVSGRRMGICIDKAFKKNKINEEQYERLLDKALICHQKMNMIYYGREKAEEVYVDFELVQNMDIPALFGEDKTKLLFYTENMILSARSALDVATYIFSQVLLNKRIDSFNNFAKAILKSKDERFLGLGRFLEDEGDNSTSAYRLLCGITKGRSLRDIVAHQSNVRLEYCEYKEDSEKEKLFIIIDRSPYDYNWFIENFCDDVDNILSNVLEVMENFF